MGLDMYLETRIYGSKFFGETYEPTLANTAKQLGMVVRQDLPSYTLEVTSAYWRKANQIHAWFITQCSPNGEDNCQPIYVTLEQLTRLRDLCSHLLIARNAEQAKAQLPPQSGFFFGGTEINDWYWSDLEHTVKQLTAIIDGHKPEFDYYYRASW